MPLTILPPDNTTCQALHRLGIAFIPNYPNSSNSLPAQTLKIPLKSPINANFHPFHPTFSNIFQFLVFLKITLKIPQNPFWSQFCNNSLIFSKNATLDYQCIIIFLCFFFKNKLSKVWSVYQKAIPLHSLSKRRAFKPNEMIKSKRDI